jgi:hypothetical protein
MPHPIATEGQLRVGLGVAEDDLTAQQRALLTMLHPMVEQEVRSYLGYDPVYSKHREYYPVQEEPAGEPGSVDDSLYLPEVELISGQARSFVVGNTSPKIISLRHIPVRSITTVKYDPNGRFGQGSNAFNNSDTTTLTAGTDFWIENEEAGLSRSGILEHSTGWPTERGSIEVEYWGGFQRDELQGWGQAPAADLVHAVVLAVAKNWRMIQQSWKNPLTGAIAPGPVTSERLQDYAVSYDAASAAMLSGKVALPQEVMAKLEPYRHFGRDLI